MRQLLFFKTTFKTFVYIFWDFKEKPEILAAVIDQRLLRGAVNGRLGSHFRSFEEITFENI